MSDIHQEITLPADPDRVYRVYMSSKEHGAFTGGAAQIPGEAGAAFTCHDGKIEGRNIELVPGERIVQAWRAANWPAGVYSVVKFELAADGDGTMLTMDQSGVPDDARDHIDGGWHKMYWEPLRKYL